MTLWIGLMAGIVLLALPTCVMVVMDFRMMQIKGEAVARGQAHVVDGEWGWNDD